MTITVTTLLLQTPHSIELEGVAALEAHLQTIGYLQRAVKKPYPDVSLAAYGDDDPDKWDGSRYRIRQQCSHDGLDYERAHLIEFLYSHQALQFEELAGEYEVEAG